MGPRSEKQFVACFQASTGRAGEVILRTSARVTLSLQAKDMQNLHDFMHMRRQGSNSRDLEALNAVAEVLFGGSPKNSSSGMPAGGNPFWEKG